MDPETRDMIEGTLELVRENNRMLRKVRGVQQREMIYRTVKIFVMVGIALGLFYFLQPFINQVTGFYSWIFGAQGSSMPGALENFGN